jgi:type I restriction enzyme S subunit
MTNLVDLSPAHFAIVEHILAEHVPECEVRAFGSRATWNARDTSDLDLAVIGDGPLPSRILTMLKEAFEESRLPMRVDVIDWNVITDGFRKSIAPDSVVVQGVAASSPWPVARLGNCIVTNEETVSSKDAWAYINYLDTGNITENHIDEIQHLVVGKDKVPTRARRKVRKGDIVYSTVRPNQRHYGLLNDIPENLLASTGFVVIRGKEGVAHTDFVYWLLAQDHIVEYLQAIAEHSTSAYPSIRPSDIKAIEFRLPSFEEQRCIADILGTLDDKIELNRRMSRTLEEMARALFKSWFVDFNPVRAKANSQPSGLPPDLDVLFPESFEASELGEIPAGWEVILAGEAMQVYGGSTPSTKEPAYWGGEHHFATPKDLSMLQEPVLISTARRLTEAGISRIRSGLLPPRTVLLSSRAPIGYLAVTETQVAINQGIVAMVCDGSIGALYALHWSHANMLVIEARSSGTTFPEISKSSFRGVPFLVPTESVHAAWEALVTPLYNQIASNAHQSHNLAEQRDVLLPRLISGAVRLNPRGDH